MDPWDRKRRMESFTERLRVFPIMGFLRPIVFTFLLLPTLTSGTYAKKS
jgi:hypothetical protein